jgi:hypothetical protein
MLTPYGAALMLETQDQRQNRCLEIGFKYWRAPDAHGVTCTPEQAIEFIQEMVGVEVEIKPAPIALPIEPCLWTVDDEGTWSTECGNAFQFEVDGPHENNAWFCQYCGHPIDAVHANH